MARLGAGGAMAGGVEGSDISGVVETGEQSGWSVVAASALDGLLRDA